MWILIIYVEIEFLRKKNRIPESVTILTIEDPAKNLGSGAATLNALLVATEYLSAKRNYMVYVILHPWKIVLNFKADLSVWWFHKYDTIFGAVYTFFSGSTFGLVYPGSYIVICVISFIIT